MIKLYKNFLPEVMAENLHRSVYDCDSGWWEKVRLINGDHENIIRKDYTVDGLSENYDDKLSQSLRNGAFTYSFTTSKKHFNTCNCFQCEFRTYASYVLKDHIEKNSDIGSVELDEMFFSVYERGDFLSTHEDTNKGDVAFVLNLTKNWRPEYGGVFHCEGEYIVPEFNSLMLLYLGDSGVPHHVSEVSQRAPHPRIAISGWFRKSK